MEVLLKKYFWAFNTVLLVAAGFATAKALSSYVAYEVLEVPIVQSTQETKEEELETADLQLGRPISKRAAELERALAAKAAPVPESTEPVAPPVESEPPEATQDQPAEQAPAPSISIEYLAGITAVDETKNLALIKVDGGEGMWVGVGDEVKAGFKVTRITNYYVTVGDSVTELLWKRSEPKPALADAGGVPGMPPRKGQPQPREPGQPDVPKPTPTAPKPAESPKQEGIKQMSEWEYQIDRNRLNEELQDMGKLGRDARVMPNYDRDSGTYQGFKLIGVKPNSLYRAIGIRSGDVLLQVNGQELSSPTKALELFNQLQTSSNITIDIMRQGQKHTLVYKIE